MDYEYGYPGFPTGSQQTTSDTPMQMEVCDDNLDDFLLESYQRLQLEVPTTLAVSDNVTQTLPAAELTTPFLELKLVQRKRNHGNLAGARKRAARTEIPGCAVYRAKAGPKPRRDSEPQKKNSKEVRAVGSCIRCWRSKRQVRIPNALAINP